MCVDKINYVISKFDTTPIFRSRDNSLRAYVLRPHLRNNRNLVPGIQHENGSPCSGKPPNRCAMRWRTTNNYICAMRINYCDRKSHKESTKHSHFFRCEIKILFLMFHLCFRNILPVFHITICLHFFFWSWKQSTKISNELNNSYLGISLCRKIILHNLIKSYF